MGFSHLRRTETALVNFRARFAIPLEVVVAYCHEDNIEIERYPLWCSSCWWIYWGWGKISSKSIKIS